MAWLLFHVAFHKDVQKNLTVEVKNSISREVSKYFSEYFSFVEAECSKRNSGKSEEFVYLFVCLSSLR